MDNQRNETLRERIGTLIQEARNGTTTADDAAGRVVTLIHDELGILLAGARAKQ